MKLMNRKQLVLFGGKQLEIKITLRRQERIFIITGKATVSITLINLSCLIEYCEQNFLEGEKSKFPVQKLNKKNQKFRREGGVSDFGIPKAWAGRAFWNFRRQGGGGGKNVDAARGRVWIFSGITHFETQQSPPSMPSVLQST